jgi:hypothetical protein
MGALSFGLGLRGAAGPGAAATGAVFTVTFTGLSTDAFGPYGRIGSAIGLELIPAQAEAVVKWSASANPADAATFGTGATPAPFAAADGFLVYLHVTSGAVTVSRSFPARYAPATAPTIDAQTWTADVTTVSLAAAASAANLTLGYAAAGLPAGVSIDAATGLITGVPTAASSGTVGVTATDQYGRVLNYAFQHTTSLPAPGSFGALADQTFTSLTGARTYTFAAATGAGLTWSYGLVSPPSGVTIDPATRTIMFDTDMLPPQSGTGFTVRATDQYGRTIDRSASFTVVSLPAVIVITSAGPQAANGDVPISYSIDKDDPAVRCVVFDAAAPDPVAADFGGNNEPAYVDQGSVSLTASGGPIDIEIAGLFEGPVRMAFLPTGGGNGDVAVSGAFTLDTNAPTISILSPADNATGVAANANLVMTFSEAMKRQGTLELRHVGGSLIQSFDLATGGAWSLGDTVWTGDPAAEFTQGATLCVRWSGLEDLKGNALAGNGGDTAWNFAVAGAAMGLTLLMQTVATASASQHDISVTGVAGQTVVVVGNWTGSPTLTSLVVDPGGPNQTTATIRQQGSSSNASHMLCDVVWPATGSLNVRATWSGNNGTVGYTVLSAGTRTHQASKMSPSTGANPENHVETINTAPGQSAIFATAMAANGAVTLSSGVNAVVGSTLALAGGRFAYIAKADSVAGGAPQTFRMDWPALAFVPGNGILGIYG